MRYKNIFVVGSTISICFVSSIVNPQITQAGCSSWNPFCSPPEPKRIRDVYDFFYVNNKSKSVAYVAYITYVPGSDYMGTIEPPRWWSTGWFVVNPGQNSQIYKTKNKGEKIYVRMEEDGGGEIVPSKSSGETYFCISNHKYDSWQAVGTSSYTLRINDNSSRSGIDCSELGGKLRKFWKMSANTSFTIN